jgi:hypothetical protein
MYFPASGALCTTISFRAGCHGQVGRREGAESIIPAYLLNGDVEDVLLLLSILRLCRQKDGSQYVHLTALQVLHTSLPLPSEDYPFPAEPRGLSLRTRLTV